MYKQQQKFVEKKLPKNDVCIRSLVDLSRYICNISDAFVDLFIYIENVQPEFTITWISLGKCTDEGFIQ